jgi:hypothetical protein
MFADSESADGVKSLAIGSKMSQGRVPQSLNYFTWNVKACVVVSESLLRFFVGDMSKSDHLNYPVYPGMNLGALLLLSTPNITFFAVFFFSVKNLKFLIRGWCFIIKNSQNAKNY